MTHFLADVTLIILLLLVPATIYDLFWGNRWTNLFCAVLTGSLAVACFLTVLSIMWFGL